MRRAPCVCECVLLARCRRLCLTVLLLLVFVVCHSSAANEVCCLLADGSSHLVARIELHAASVHSNDVTHSQRGEGRGGRAEHVEADAVHHSGVAQRHTQQMVATGRGARPPTQSSPHRSSSRRCWADADCPAHCSGTCCYCRCCCCYSLLSDSCACDQWCTTLLRLRHQQRAVRRWARLQRSEPA